MSVGVFHFFTTSILRINIQSFVTCGFWAFRVFESVTVFGAWVSSIFNFSRYKLNGENGEQEKQQPIQ
jgi:hypothetical protein